VSTVSGEVMLESTETTKDLFGEAALARRLAAELCTPGGCAWYHGFWPYLRAMELAGTPDRHRPFYRRTLGAALHDGCRVLICGAADAGMLSVVLDVAAGADVHPRVTVFDRCPTPLAVSAAHARGAGVEIELWNADLFDAVRPAGFDVLCTHGLLPFLPMSKRLDAICRFAQLLRPGGVVVTTSSLAKPSAPAVSVFTDEAAAAFAEHARAAAAASPELGLAPEDAADSARVWAARAETHPFRSPEELRELLEAGGLSIVDLRVTAIDGPVSDREAGPWTAKSGRWAEIMARRD
jgi:hypothetical protein